MTGARRTLVPALLFVFGVTVSLYYGRRGYMPLDQSIVFDGGWRILSGQVPFRDYHAPNGFTVHALQALFFAVGGVNWFTYCLHAAVVNGLFALLVAGLLIRMGLFRWAAYGYGALSALVLYPPFGVPYMDQHAFFFSLAAIYLAVAARQAEAEAEAVGQREHRPGRSKLWLAVPGVLLLAGLSKQIPSVFALPIVLAVALVDRRGPALRRARALALGSLAALAPLVLGAVLLGVDFERVELYFSQLPAEVGQYRYTFVPGLGPILERMRYTGEVLGLRSIPLVHWAAALGLATSVVLALASKRRRGRLLAPATALLLAEALLGICLLFIAFTSNQPEIGVPFVFLAVGLVHCALERSRDSLLRARRVWLAAAPRVLGVGLLAVAAVDGWHFTRAVNATRRVNDIEWYPPTAAISAPRVHPDLAFMRWQLPPVDFITYGPAHLAGVVEYLKQRGEPFFTIGDASILYGLTGQPSAAPSLWFHQTLTLPKYDDPRLADYETLLLERLEDLDVGLVVLEGQRTWISTRLSDFPRLAARLDTSAPPAARFGPFEVFELSR